MILICLLTVYLSVFCSYVIFIFVSHTSVDLALVLHHLYHLQTCISFIIFSHKLILLFSVAHQLYLVFLSYLIFLQVQPLGSDGGPVEQYSHYSEYVRTGLLGFLGPVSELFRFLKMPSSAL